MNELQRCDSPRNGVPTGREARDAPEPPGTRTAARSVSDPRWRDEAARRNHPEPDLWFRAKGESSWPAKRTCQRCPVRVACLDAAVANGERHGIWGGAGHDLLRPLRAAHRTRPHPEPLLDHCGCLWCTQVRLHFERLDLEVGAQYAAASGDQLAAARLRKAKPQPPRRFGRLRHGTRLAYNRGCDCGPCQLAASLDGFRRATTTTQIGESA
jgi:WhiB family redox-sensing transcriptional regulator